MGSLLKKRFAKVFLPDERNAQEETAHPAWDMVIREWSVSSCSSRIVTMWRPTRGRKPMCTGMQGRRMESNGFFDNDGTM